MNRLIFLLSITLLTFSCDNLKIPTSHQIKLLTWNTENLFDDQKDGQEYPEFDPEKGWGQKEYWSRLEACAQVITHGGPGRPDIILLQELENAGVLETLRTRFLDPGEYSYGLLIPDSRSRVNVGILSRWPMVNSGVLTPEDPGQGGRPILEVRVKTPQGDLVVFNNHWKSRIPDIRSTEPLREVTAKLLSRRMSQLKAQGQPFIAAGDFNTYPRPGFSGALGFGAEGVLGLSPGREAGALVWDAWSLSSEKGSYFYQGQWEPLDHFLLGEPEKGFSSVGFQVLRPERMVNSQGHPVPWSVRNPRGVSDHLPLWLAVEL